MGGIRFDLSLVPPSQRHLYTTSIPPEEETEDSSEVSDDDDCHDEGHEAYATEYCENVRRGDMHTPGAVYGGADDNEKEEVLKLGKQKQELELENQKLKLKQIEQQSKEEEEASVKGVGLCNEQHNFDEKDDNLSLLNTADCNSDYYTLN